MATRASSIQEQPWYRTAATVWWRHWFALLAVNTISVLLCLSLVLIPAGVLLPFLAAEQLTTSGRLQPKLLWQALLHRLPAALLFTVLNLGFAAVFQLAATAYVTAGLAWLVPPLYAVAFIWLCLQLQVLAVVARSGHSRLRPVLHRALRLLFRAPAGALLLGVTALLLGIVTVRLPVLLLAGVPQLLPLAAAARAQSPHLLMPEPVTDMPSMK